MVVVVVVGRLLSSRMAAAEEIREGHRQREGDSTLGFGIWLNCLNY